MAKEMVGLPHFDSTGRVLDRQGRPLVTTEETIILDQKIDAVQSSVGEVKDDLDSSIDDVHTYVDSQVVNLNPGKMYTFESSATWNIENYLDRLPNVTFYIDGIGPILQEYEVDGNNIVVTWPYPVSGIAVLT